MTKSKSFRTAIGINAYHSKASALKVYENLPKALLKKEKNCDINKILLPVVVQWEILCMNFLGKWCGDSNVWSASQGDSSLFPALLTSLRKWLLTEHVHSASWRGMTIYVGLNTTSKSSQWSLFSIGSRLTNCPYSHTSHRYNWEHCLAMLIGRLETSEFNFVLSFACQSVTARKETIQYREYNIG